MDSDQLKTNIAYLVDKYAPNRIDLKELIINDLGCVKYILAEIDMEKKCEYAREDIDLIKDIAYYYV